MIGKETIDAVRCPQSDATSTGWPDSIAFVETMETAMLDRAR